MYLKNMMFSSQEEIVYPISVSSESYLLDIDGRSVLIRTESNGCWGYGCFLYRGKVLDALILDIGLPEIETMESAEQLIITRDFHSDEPDKVTNEISVGLSMDISDGNGYCVSEQNEEEDT